MPTHTYRRTRRPRRARWEATCEKNGLQSVRHALGATAQEAIDAWNYNGFKVLTVPQKVQRGQANGNKRKLPLNQFYVDKQALAEAQRHIGLAIPIVIKLTGHQGGRRGAYRACDGYHRITLKSWMDYEQASRTLWHELCHAAQAERIARDSGHGDIVRAQRQMQNASRNVSYLNKRHEVEARSWESRAAERPLTKPTSFALKRP